MPDAPTPLDLDALAAECDLADRDMRKWVRYPVKHLRSLLAEVERLRAEVEAVKPGRGAVVRAIFDAEYPDIAEAEREAEWGIITSAGHGSAWHRQADAVLDLWPGESRAAVQAEALRDAADAVTEIDGRADDDAARWLRDRADRLAAEGGADRG